MDAGLSRRWFAAWVCLFVLAAGCATQSGSALQPLPTLAELPQVPPLPLEDAERTARAFLEAWKAGDTPGMYDLLAFSSQEATPRDSFITFYNNAAREMTLQGLTYAPNTLYSDETRADVAIFSYNVMFDTRMLGSFADNNRTLRLVVDPRAQEWRVAWTPGDIFAELAGGGQLRLELSVPSRANIYDRKDRVLADQNGRVVVVQAIKREIADWPACLSVLAVATGKAPSDIQKTYDESSPDWLMELGVIEPIIYEQSQTALETSCAARFNSRAARRYTNATVAPNIVGVVGYPSAEQVPAVQAAGFTADSILGQSGIEQSWDQRLRGQPGGRLVISSPAGQIVREVARSASHPAESVWLTLDVDVQTKITQILASYYDNARDSWGKTSNGAAAVIIDVRTGAILAMVSYPTYDSSAFAPFPPMGRAEANRIVAALQSDPRRPLLNRASQGLYPLGSVMKVVSSIAVADTGVYELTKRFTCTGIWNRDITRYDWLPGGHGTLTISGAITQSCNPFFYEVGYQLNQYDPYALPSYARRLGLGVASGLTDIAESPGLIPDPDWKRVTTGLEWTFSDAVNMAIGQGELQITPLQVARVFSAVANGGTLYRPQLVEKAGLLGEAPTFTMTPDPLSTINVRPEVLDIVREGLCNVTTARAGTAEYQFRNYTELQKIGVCGKTGTAQNRPGAMTHAWFAAYAPRDYPEIAIAVIVENAGEGSGVAAPIVRDILNYYLVERKG